MTTITADHLARRACVYIRQSVSIRGGSLTAVLTKDLSISGEALRTSQLA